MSRTADAVGTTALPTSHIVRTCVWVLAGFVAILAARSILNYLFMSWTAIVFPDELDYGEGIIWRQAMMMPDGGMYGDITRLPYIVFHYPPVYHLCLRLLALSGIPVLEAGRGLSFIAACGTAASAAAITRHAFTSGFDPATRRIAVVATAFVTLDMWPFEVWSVVMRVDMLAICLSFLGVACALRSVGRPALLYAAMTFFVLSVYTKQTSIAAPLATMTIMLAATPRQAIRALAFGLALGLAALAVLTAYTSGGFLRHVVYYNINRFSIAAAIRATRSLPYHAVYLCFACVGLALGWRRLRREMCGVGWSAVRDRLATDAFARSLAIVTLYFCFSMVLSATVAKSGGSYNYLIEWMCVWGVATGMFAGLALAPGITGGGAPLRSFAILALAAFQIITVPDVWHPALRGPRADAQRAQLEVMIGAASTPVLSDDMVLLMKAGKPVMWEPAIFAELASVGAWDERLITDRIRAHEFSMIITDGRRGDAAYDARFNPAVDLAIRQSYPLESVLAEHIVHTPP